MNPDKVRIKDLNFKKFIDSEDIAAAIDKMGTQIGTEYQGKTPILLGVLSGCFVFMADLIRAIDTPKEVLFIRAKSYEGLSSTGNVQLEPLPDKLKGRDIIIIEDIVDKGHTLDALLKAINDKVPNSVKVASFLLKPDAYEYTHKVDYCCFEVANDFVLGYGLDYDQFGRGLKSLYKLEG